MKNPALFSSKDKNEKLKCRLLQFLFGALRVNIGLPTLNYQYKHSACLLANTCTSDQALYRFEQYPKRVLSEKIRVAHSFWRNYGTSRRNRWILVMRQYLVASSRMIKSRYFTSKKRGVEIDSNEC